MAWDAQDVGLAAIMPFFNRHDNEVQVEHGCVEGGNLAGHV